MVSVNEKLLDRAVDHHVQVQHYTATVGAEYGGVLDDARQQISDLIKSVAAADGSIPPLELTDLTDKIAAIVRDLETVLSNEWSAELENFIELEGDEFYNLILDELPDGIEPDLPDIQDLLSDVENTPIEGRYIEDWINDFGDSLERGVTTSIMAGIATGITVANVVESFKTLPSYNGRSLDNMQRTIWNGVANETRLAVAAANPDLVDYVQWHATLDARTCIQCADLDGQVFSIDEVDPPPAHPSCRCFIVPVLRGHRDIARVSTKHEKAIRFMHPDDRSSFNGKPAQRLRFENWLKRQTHDIQNESLGPARAKLWRDGKLSIERFVSSEGRILTLAQLRQRQMLSWRKAGLKNLTVPTPTFNPYHDTKTGEFTTGPDQQATENSKQQVLDIAHNIAKKLGFNPDNISLSDDDHHFELNGQHMVAGGTALGQQVTLHYNQLRNSDPKGLEGLVAHEIEHCKFSNAVAVYGQQLNEVLTLPPTGNALTNDAMNFDGSLKPPYDQKYSAYSLWNQAYEGGYKDTKVRGVDVNAFAIGDGVSDYSWQYWKQWFDTNPTGNRLGQGFHTAVTETLSEMARLKLETGKFPEHMGERIIAWRQNLLGTDKKPSKDEIAAGQKLWRDLYRAVDKIWDDTMLVRTKVQNRPALAMYMKRDFTPVDRVEDAEVVKVSFLDHPQSVFLYPQDDGDGGKRYGFNPNHDQNGRFASGPGWQDAAEALKPYKIGGFDGEKFATVAERGAFEVAAEQKDLRNIGTTSTVLHFRAKDIPADWQYFNRDMVGGTSRNGKYFDPNYAEVRNESVTGSDGKKIEYQSLAIKDSTVLNFPDKAEPGIIYRGMSYEEYESAQKTGYYQSKGDYNLGEAQKGLTYYSTEPDQAVAYANGFAPWQYGATPAKPAVVVAVRDPGNHVEVPGLGRTSSEVGIRGKVPVDSTHAVYFGKPIICSEGSIELYKDRYGRDANKWQVGSGTSPSASVRWEREDKKLGTRYGFNPKKYGINPNHIPAGDPSGKGGQFATGIPLQLPPEPGTVPIPDGDVRLYHQTKDENLADIAKNGIQISKARGIEGPLAIYADEKGFYGKPDEVPTVEFHVPKERWDPPFVRADSVKDDGRVAPENIIAIHMPWHRVARYIEDNPEVLKETIAGENDKLMEDSYYRNAILYIKQKYGGHVAEGEKSKVDKATRYGFNPNHDQKGRFASGASLDGVTFYHGTDADIVGDFDLALAGSNFGDSASKQGAIFFAENRKLAQYYGKNVVERSLQLSNPQVVDVETVFRKDYDLAKRKGDVSGTFADFATNYHPDGPYAYYEVGLLSHDVRDAKRNNHDGLILDFGNIVDPRFGPLKRVAVVFDPSVIKSAGPRYSFNPNHDAKTGEFSSGGSNPFQNQDGSWKTLYRGIWGPDQASEVSGGLESWTSDRAVAEQYAHTPNDPIQLQEYIAAGNKINPHVLVAELQSNKPFTMGANATLDDLSEQLGLSKKETSKVFYDIYPDREMEGKSVKSDWDIESFAYGDSKVFQGLLRDRGYDALSYKGGYVEQDKPKQFIDEFRPLDPAIVKRKNLYKVERPTFNPNHDDHGRFTSGVGTALLAKIERDGGFTYNIVSRKSPKAGYAFSPYKDREFVLAADALTPNNMASYIRQNKTTLKQADHYLGAWRNPEDGNVYLDISLLKQDRTEAEQLAREHHQLALFDLYKKETIYVKDNRKGRVYSDQGPGRGGYRDPVRAVDGTQTDRSGNAGGRKDLGGTGDEVDSGIRYGFNPNHDPKTGQFATGSGGSTGDLVAGRDGDHPGHGYSKDAYIENGVIQTDNVLDATRALYENKRVNLEQPREASVLIDHLGQVAKNMIKLGEKAPVFNLCNVTISNTNLFCAESKGIPRIQMPQLGKDINSFTEWLTGKGYKITNQVEHAANLRPTQNQLNGASVAAVANKIDTIDGYGNRPIVVSRDNYILDGHHLWAAQVGIDARNNVLRDDKPMSVSRVDIGIVDLLHRAEEFTQGAGKMDIDDRRRKAIRYGQPWFDPDQPRDEGGKWAGGGGGRPSIREDLSRGKNESQPVKNIDDLYAKAKADEPVFNAMVQQFADSVNGTPVWSPAGPDGSRLKSKDRVEQKVQKDYGGDYSQIKDIIRATVATDTVREARIAAAAFIGMHGKDVVRVKDRYASEGSGYRDILVNVRTPSGLIAELQFNSKTMLMGKFARGHQLYEKVRAAPNSNIGTMAKGTFIPAMKKLYDDAYHKDGNGNWVKKKKK